MGVDQGFYVTQTKSGECLVELFVCHSWVVVAFDLVHCCVKSEMDGIAAGWLWNVMWQKEARYVYGGWQLHQ